MASPKENQEVQKLLFDEDVVRVSDTGYLGAVYSGRVHCVARNESFLIEDRELTLEGRSFGIGDIVSRIGDLGKQAVVLSVNHRVDLSGRANGAGFVNIGVGDIDRMRNLFVGDFVVYKTAWLGLITETDLSVSVKFEDGTKLSGVDPDPQKLVPEYTNKLEEYLNWPYYLGQAVSHDTYIHGLPTIERGEVTKHKTQTVYVKWIPGREPEENQPPIILGANSVTPLRPAFFAQAGLRLGHRCRLNGEEYLISNVYGTLVTVEWKSGVREEIDGRELMKIDTSEEFFDGIFQICSLVQRKEVIEELPVFGMVKLVNIDNVEVEWADGTSTKVDPEDINIVEDPDEEGDGYDDAEKENDGGDDSSDNDNDGGEDSLDGGGDSSDNDNDGGEDSSDNDSDGGDDTSDGDNDGGEVMDP